MLLANRMKPIMTKVIYLTQVPFIEGRNIWNNEILAIKVLQTFKKMPSLKHLCLIVYLTKEFPCVNWKALITNLLHIGFQAILLTQLKAKLPLLYFLWFAELHDVYFNC